jgi:hypothetical protein
MTGIILKIIIFAAVAWFVVSGLRKLWRDLSKPFRNDAPPPGPAPNLKEQRGNNVIDLQRDADGVYRPPGDRDRR